MVPTVGLHSRCMVRTAAVVLDEGERGADLRAVGGGGHRAGRARPPLLVHGLGHLRTHLHRRL